MSDQMQAARQWANRPVDQRFWNVRALGEYTQQVRRSCKEIGKGDFFPVPVRSLSVVPTAGDDMAVIHDGTQYTPTNWSFGQLCGMAGKDGDPRPPKGYLSTLPSEMACDCLNHSLRQSTENAQLLTLQNGNGAKILRAITSPTYERFWDSQLCELLMPLSDSGWKTPPARSNGENDPRTRPATENDLIPGMKGGAQVRVGEMIAPAGVYRSDRDSFIFIVNPNREIDGGDDNGGLFKGLIASNSEVGNASVRLTSFCHEGVCGNHIIWGMTKSVMVKANHTKNVARTIRSAFREWFGKFEREDAAATSAMIVNAKRFVLGATDEEVKELLRKKISGFTLKAIDGALAYAKQWEHTAHASPRTAWGFVHGLTRYSQTATYLEQRHALDMIGGEILTLAQ